MVCGTASAVILPGLGCLRHIAHVARNVVRGGVSGGVSLHLIGQMARVAPTSRIWPIDSTDKHATVRSHRFSPHSVHPVCIHPQGSPRASNAGRRKAPRRQIPTRLSYGTRVWSSLLWDGPFITPVWVSVSFSASPFVSPSHLSALSPPCDARLTVPATRVWRGSLGRDIISHPSPPRLFRHGYYGFLVYRIRKRVYAHHRAASGTFPMYTRMEKGESNDGQ